MAWSSVVFLYSLHLSYILIFDTSLVVQTVCWIIIPFFTVAAGWVGWRVLTHKPSHSRAQEISIPSDEFDQIDRLLRRSFAIWILLTIVEIIVSGGLPILWLIRGSSKTYFDFGIPTVHGFLNSLLLSIGVCQIALFAFDNKKKRLMVPGFIVVWSVIVVTRNMMMVLIIEGAITWGLLRGFSSRKILKAFAALVVLVLIFGYIGDFRSGAEAFRNLAQPTDDYPAWLPSGVLWGYIYLTTPVGNVVNTVVFGNPVNNLLFPNTTSLLFPSVLRSIIYGNGAADEAFSGNLVTDAFNVSTAYVGPFQDFGHLGLVLFSILLAVVALITWSRRSLRGIAIYAVIGQCVVLSVFFNHLFYLPVITQVIWLFFFLRDPAGRSEVIAG